MKKLLLLGALVCAGQLYSMENIHETAPWKSLNSDVQREIIKMILATNKYLDDAVKTINTACILERIRCDNLKNFTQLVSMLEEKFPSYTKQEIAEKFNTPLALQYINLNLEFILNIKQGKSIEKIKQLIDQGVDVNFSSSSVMLGGSPLAALVKSTRDMDKNHAIAIMHLLLSSGANPNFKTFHGESALRFMQSYSIPEEFKQLLNNAMKK
jgi:hypothetical protein